MLYGRYQDPELMTPSAIDSIQRIAYGFYITLVAAFGAIAIGMFRYHKGKVEIVDLRTIHPLDEKLIFETVKKHGKCLVITEEPFNNSFAQALSGKIQENCFRNLDAPVFVMGSENLPAIPLNSTLEKTMIPNTEKVSKISMHRINIGYFPLFPSYNIT